MRNIKKIRVLKDYTQLKMQMETGISQSILSKYERGELMPTCDNLQILADFYHTSTDIWLDRTDETKPYPVKKSRPRAAFLLRGALWQKQSVNGLPQTPVPTGWCVP